MKAINVTNLVKKYDDVTAVDGVSFTVAEGELFAYLGENGAGKSTTISIISTLLKKTAGEVSVCGYRADSEDDKIRQSIGIVFQEGKLDKLLTVRENIMIRGALYNMSTQEVKERAARLEQALDAADFMDRRYGKLSGGQRRRADILRALINKPKVLILDEPTTGLDPASRKKVWNIVQKLREEEGLTVFLTTHYMEEAAIADHICVLYKGKIAAFGTPETLRLEYSRDKLVLIADGDKRQKLIEKLKGKAVKTDRDRLIVEIPDSLSAIDILNEVRGDIRAFEVVRGNMDDAFININAKYEGGSI